MDLFFQVSRLCREADALLQQREKASSPLLKVALFEPGQDLVEKLGAAQRLIGTKQEELMSDLKHLDAAWASVSGDSTAGGAGVTTIGRALPPVQLFQPVDRANPGTRRSTLIMITKPWLWLALSQASVALVRGADLAGSPAANAAAAGRR